MDDEPHGDLGELLDEAERSAIATLITDPEWTIPRWTHVHELVTAFVVGVLRADAWYRGYRTPPHFAEVVDRVAAAIQARWPDEEVVQVSLWDYEQFLRETCAADAQVLAWNDAPDGAEIRIAHRGSPPPTARDFIDLGAMFRNAAVFLRNEHRRNDEFDRRFEQEHSG